MDTGWRPTVMEVIKEFDSSLLKNNIFEMKNILWKFLVRYLLNE